jgi:hypothetical protein
MTKNKVSKGFTFAEINLVKYNLVKYNSSGTAGDKNIMGSPLLVGSPKTKAKRGKGSRKTGPLLNLSEITVSGLQKSFCFLAHFSPLLERVNFHHP